MLPGILKPRDGRVQTIFAAAAGVLWFVYSSCELYDCLRHYYPEAALGALSVLWGIYALLMVGFGVTRNIRTLRGCGLALFVATGAKAMIFDLAGVAALYRILAFILMGLAMLGGAFVYMKFRDNFGEEKQ